MFIICLLSIEVLMVAFTVYILSSLNFQNVFNVPTFGNSLFLNNTFMAKNGLIKSKFNAELFDTQSNLNTHPNQCPPAASGTKKLGFLTMVAIKVSLWIKRQVLFVGSFFVAAFQNLKNLFYKSAALISKLLSASSNSTKFLLSILVQAINSLVKKFKSLSLGRLRRTTLQRTFIYTEKYSLSYQRVLAR